MGEDKNNNSANTMCYICFIGITPILIILFLYINNQDSHLLTFISSFADDTPIFFSNNDILLSTVMSLYVKASPLYALLFFIATYKRINIDKSLPTLKITTTLFLFSIFYITSMFFLLFQNVDLNTSGRLLRLLSINHYVLTLLFILVFTCCYILTCYYVSFIYASFIVFKDRFLF